MKKIPAILFSVLLLLGVLSKDIIAASIPTPTPTPTPSPITVSSFELFWPIAAGKTMEDPLYFFKTLKENLRGKLIFGAPQRADYSIFLATKRIVETEKLILEGKSDLAEKTLARATKLLDKAIVDVDQALAKGVPFQDQAVNMGNRLSNLETFLPWLASNFDRNKEAINAVLEKIKTLNQKI